MPRALPRLSRPYGPPAASASPGRLVVAQRFSSHSACAVAAVGAAIMAAQHDSATAGRAGQGDAPLCGRQRIETARACHGHHLHTRTARRSGLPGVATPDCDGEATFEGHGYRLDAGCRRGAGPLDDHAPVRLRRPSRRLAQPEQRRQLLAETPRLQFRVSHPAAHRFRLLVHHSGQGPQLSRHRLRAAT